MRYIDRSMVAANGDVGAQDPFVTDVEEERGLRGVVRHLARENKVALVSVFVILAFVVAAICAPLLAPYGYADMDLANRLLPPSLSHPLGTDEGGRDVLSRLLYGSRVSLLVGVVPTLLSMVVGTLLGVLAGYLGGTWDTIIMRVVDIVLSFPSMLLAMVVMYTLGDGIVNVLLTMALVSWAGVARVVRSQTLSLKQGEYVEAARVIGVRWPTILVRHILPNCIPTLIVLFTLEIPSAILTESSLSFLGMGVQPPEASWGLMVNTGRQYLFYAPWLCFAPCAAIMIVVLAFNYVGDGLRDALDPHQSDE